MLNEHPMGIWPISLSIQSLSPHELVIYKETHIKKRGINDHIRLFPMIVAHMEAVTFFRLILVENLSISPSVQQRQ